MLRPTVGLTPIPIPNPSVDCPATSGFGGFGVNLGFGASIPPAC